MSYNIFLRYLYFYLSFSKKTAFANIPKNKYIFRFLKFANYLKKIIFGSVNNLHQSFHYVLIPLHQYKK